MQMAPYLSFKGQCEEAFKFYEKCLGAKPGSMFRYEGTPAAEHAPKGWANKVMHGSITIDGQTLMGADPPPDHYQEPKGFSLSLHAKTAADAERLFADLTKGGKVVMPLEKTFWAERFGMLVDRFGIPWMINCEGAQGSHG